MFIVRIFITVEHNNALNKSDQMTKIIRYGELKRRTAARVCVCVCVCELSPSSRQLTSTLMLQNPLVSNILSSSETPETEELTVEH